MTGREKCQQLGDELAELKGLRDDFARELEKSVRDGDLSGQRLVDLKDVISALLKGDTELAKLWVPPEFEHLKLKGQYDSQVKVAWKSGLFGDRLNRPVKSGMQLHLQPEGMHAGLPVIERNGQKYPMPTWKEVQKILRKPENKEIIKEKSKQGFTKMLIVPFGYDLKTMCHKFKDKVRSGINADGTDISNKGIFDVKGKKIEFDRDDEDYPVFIWEGWDDGQIVYNPKKYDQRNHGGMMKEDAIKINGAWQICFIEDMPVIPLDGKEKGGRKQIDRKGSCIKGQTAIPTIQEFKELLDDKQKMNNPNSYKYERGMTPEKYLWMQFSSLSAKEKPVLMDYENDEWRGTYLIECYNIVSDDVLIADWAPADRLIGLEGNSPDFQSGGCGVRASVDIMK